MRLPFAALLSVACGATAPARAPDADVAPVADVAAAADGAVAADGGDGSIFCDLNCDDGNPCTSDVCYIKIGCTHIPHAGGCEDGNPCTTGDNCSTGACVGKPMDCDDSQACTDDSCVLPGTCTHTSHC